MEQNRIEQVVWRRSFMRLCWIFLIILLLGILYTAYSIWSYGQKSEKVQADAAIVLGAATVSGKPSPVLKGRIDHAVALYHQGDVKKLIFTGGSGEEGEISEAESSRVYALSQQVKAEDIILETTSTITEENLQNAKIAAEEHGVTSFLIVSDPLHMKRAMVMAEDLDMNVYSSPSQFSAYQSYKTKLPFLAREVFYYLGYLVTSPFR